MVIDVNPVVSSRRVILNPFFGCHQATANTTVYESSKGELVFLRLDMISFVDDRLNPVKFVFGYHGLVIAWIENAPVEKGAVIEWIGKELVNA